jgi:hypothetical protein
MSEIVLLVEILTPSIQIAVLFNNKIHLHGRSITLRDDETIRHSQRNTFHHY